MNLLPYVLFRFPMGLLCQFEGFAGMLQGLFRVFMSAQMVALSVMLHCYAVRVGCQLVKLGGSLMRIFHLA